MQNFILSVDPSSISPNLAQVHAFIKTNRNVEQWFMPYQGLYILKSSMDIQPFILSFDEFLSGAFYVITPIKGAETGGRLPLEIWNWINFDVAPSQFQITSQ
jgi:hypothetical protein